METLNCPMCGAPASTEATHCEHCGARLATVACPSCFGMMFVGAKFCSHCGAPMARTEVDSAKPQACPRCRVPLNAILVGSINLRECPHCDGIWVDAASLEQICTDREKQAAVLGMASPVPVAAPSQIDTVRYVPCPVCKKLMNRVNFAHCSNVVVDVCKGHGTWFDREELRRVVEFIRGGGLEAARTREIEELETRRRELSAAQKASPLGTEGQFADSKYDDVHFGLSATADLLRALLRK